MSRGAASFDEPALGLVRKVKSLRHDPEQRFSCGRCTRCCRNFDLPVTAAEVDALRHPALARLWSAEATPSADGREAPHDPVATLPGGRFRLRRRGDGSCGFLAADGACRIHAERGPDRKPLACRLFPFRVHPQDGPLLVTASFSCPSVAGNSGTPLARQLGEISALGKDWLRAFPQEPLSLRFTGERPLSLALAREIREMLLGVLDRKGDDGRRDLRANVARIGALLEDWTRHRVGKLQPDAFAEYVRLTGRHAVTSTRPVPEARASRVGRLLLRGFLLAVVAGRLQAGAPTRGLRLALRARLLRVTLHLHGLWPATEGLDRRAPRRVRVPLDEPALHGLVHHFLRSSLETLPTGQRSLVDELSWAFATLDAALALGAMAAARRGSDTASREDVVAGLTEAADLAQAATHGPLGRVLQSLTGGLDALHHFATTDGGKA